MAAGLGNSMEHIGLLTVPRQAREDQHCGASRGFWVGRTGLIVHPVQRNLTTVDRTYELIAISDGRSGLDEGTDQGLKPASPAPRSGTEGLSHHRTVLVEEHAESLATNQGWCLAHAAPQIVQCGREGAEEHCVRSGNTLPTCSP